MEDLSVSFESSRSGISVINTWSLIGRSLGDTSKSIFLVNSTPNRESWDYTIKSFVELERPLNLFLYACSSLPPEAQIPNLGGWSITSKLLINWVSLLISSLCFA
jgi:hypothetical protein